MFNAIPDFKTAILLRHKLNSGLKDSLIHISDAINDVIEKKSFENYKYIINKLDVSKKINPLLFMVNAKLIEKINLQDINYVQIAINNINRLDDLQIDDILICSNEHIDIYFQKLFYDLAAYDRQTKPLIKNFDFDDFSINKIRFFSALKLIKYYSYDIYQEFDTFSSLILFLNGDHIKAGSSHNAFGMIYIAQEYVKSIEEMIDTLVHEAAHQYLHLISFFDPLIKNSPEERYEAPLRKEKRPLIGIFHAVFVISRLIYLYKKINTSSLINNLELTFFETKLHYYSMRYYNGVEILNRYAKFTDIGKDIFNNMKLIIG
ncbi:MAG: hypothetical protein H0U27_03160 [Nitrosopumilus sp.]|nr:hypothetical protein [Nitrosopumilus sp.]